MYELLEDVWKEIRKEIGNVYLGDKVCEFDKSCSVSIKSFVKNLDYINVKISCCFNFKKKDSEYYEQMINLESNIHNLKNNILIKDLKTKIDLEKSKVDIFIIKEIKQS